MNLDLLYAELERDEGFRGDVYKDTRGHRTILIGHNLDAGPLCREAGKIQLSHDFLPVMQRIDARFPWWRQMSDARMRALANMAFNMGVGDLSGFTHMLAAMQAGLWDSAAKECLKSEWAAEVGPRAKRIAQMIEEG